MISVRIKQKFHDKDNYSKVYEIGDVCKFDNERAALLVSLGLAETVSQKVKMYNRKSED